MEFYACFRVRKNASDPRCSSTLVLNKISAAGFSGWAHSYKCFCQGWQMFLY